MDLIDRAEVQYKMLEILPEADSLDWYESAKPDEVKDLVDEMYSIVLSVNRIDAQPVKQGKWRIEIDRYMTSIYRCTVCGTRQAIARSVVPESVYGYCPNCGAKMCGGDTDGDQV